MLGERGRAGRASRARRSRTSIRSSQGRSRRRCCRWRRRIGSEIQYLPVRRDKVVLSRASQSRTPLNAMSFYVDNTRMIGLKKGDRVLLYDLKGRQELNGTYGEVLSYNSEKERYAVKLEEASEKILLKLANLTLIPPPDALAELDYDILLEGEDFALLKTTLLTASSRSGATTTMATSNSTRGQLSQTRRRRRRARSSTSSNAAAPRTCSRRTSSTAAPWTRTTAASSLASAPRVATSRPRRASRARGMTACRSACARTPAPSRGCDGRD